MHSPVVEGQIKSFTWAHKQTVDRRLVRFFETYTEVLKSRREINETQLSKIIVLLLSLLITSMLTTVALQLNISLRGWSPIGSEVEIGGYGIFHDCVDEWNNAILRLILLRFQVLVIATLSVDNGMTLGMECILHNPDNMFFGDVQESLRLN